MKCLNELSFYLDGTQIPFIPGQSILDAAEAADIFIPHLCHHHDLPDIGACGMCVVECSGKITKACATKAENGMQVISKSDALDHIRAVAMSLMLAAHIDDCNSCPKYLKCEFQSLIQQQGATSNLRRASRGLLQDERNPLIIRDMDRCVACGRCVRVCAEVRGVGALTYADDEQGRKLITTKGNDLLSSNCRFCGACVEVCPTGALRDKDGVFSERFTRGEKLVPCSWECPAHLDIPEYIRFIRDGRMDLAMLKIMERAPLPHSLGAICMRFCENKCRRQYVDAPVSICALKRFVADGCEDSWKTSVTPLPLNGKKVAVVGAGPTGLTAAWFLRLKGYGVKIYEQLPEPGGMMRYGMPEYRLSCAELKADIDTILSIGIELECNAEIYDRVQLESYDAVLWCGGAKNGARLPLDGADSKAALTGIEFLRNIRMGATPDIGKNVLVLGGGDVAFDCARSAIRLGASAAVCCLEPEESMTSSDQERRDGVEEGVKIYAGRTFERLVKSNDCILGMVTKRVERFEVIDGKLTVIKEPDSEELIECDTVIFAVGQRVSIPDSMHLSVNSRGQAVIDDGCRMDSKYFAAGDAVTGTSSVAQATGWGQKAAAAIDRFLGGTGDVIPSFTPHHEKDPDVSANIYFNSLRETGGTLSAQERRHSFEPYENCLDAGHVMAQAGRCLQCDLRCELKRPRFYNDYRRKAGRS